MAKIPLPCGGSLPTVEKIALGGNKESLLIRQVQYSYQTVDGITYTREQLVGDSDKPPKF